MPRPRITVITPCLNEVRFLERAVCSVLDQDYEPLEYIVVDGGSTDGSLDIVRHYRDSLVLCRGSANDGPADAINRGVARAGGDLIGILPADGVYLPGALAEVARPDGTGEVPEWMVGRCLRVDAFDHLLGWIDAVAPRSLATYLMHDSGLLPLASMFVHHRWMRSYPFDGALHHAWHYEHCCHLLARGVVPTVVGRPLAACREQERAEPPAAALAQGREFVAAAIRYGEALPPHQRYELWANCDRRRRIYSLAEAEASGGHARRFMLEQVLRHPWWLADDTIRRTLMHGVEHPLPVEMARPAA